MKRSLKLTAAALAAVTAMSFTSVTSFADSIKTVGGIKYRYSDSGELKGKYTGWAKNKNGDRYYYKNGVMLKSCWLRSGGKRTYFMRKNGKMAVGTVKISGKIYTFGADGKVLPDNFGVTMSVGAVKRETVTLIFDHDKTGLKECEVGVSDGTVVEKLNGGVWEELDPADDDVIEENYSTDIYGAERKMYKVSLDDGASLENGKYRVTKYISVESAQLVGGSMTFALSGEFEITDRTAHEFMEPPELSLIVDGTETKACTGTYSWDNEYPDGLGMSVEADSIGPLDAEAEKFTPVINMKSSGRVQLDFLSSDEPYSVSVSCWDVKYRGDYDAYNKANTITVRNSSFKPLEGTYIYEVQAKWREYSEKGKYTSSDIMMSGVVYYYFAVTASSTDQEFTYEQLNETAAALRNRSKDFPTAHMNVTILVEDGIVEVGVDELTAELEKFIDSLKYSDCVQVVVASPELD